MNLIPRDWNVPDVLRERLGDEVGRQRVMTIDGHLLLVLHEPPKPDDPERKGRLFYRSPTDVWDSSHLGAGEQALIKHIKEFATVIDQLEEQVAKAQQARDYFAVLHAITPLQRTVRNLAKVLQEARELMPKERELIIARDRAGALERACELLHADASNGLDFTIARQSEAMAEASANVAKAGHRLNLLAALFLPLSALASVFGMNLKHGMEDVNTPWLFWGVLALGMVIGLVVKAIIDKPNRAR